MCLRLYGGCKFFMGLLADRSTEYVLRQKIERGTIVTNNNYIFRFQPKYQRWINIENEETLLSKCHLFRLLLSSLPKTYFTTTRGCQYAYLRNIIIAAILFLIHTLCLLHSAVSRLSVGMLCLPLFVVIFGLQFLSKGLYRMGYCTYSRVTKPLVPFRSPCSLFQKPLGRPSYI